MLLKSLTIENFGKIRFEEIAFDPQLTVLSDTYADDVIRAIGLVTNNKTLSGEAAGQMLSCHMCIRAVLEMRGGLFQINLTGIPPNRKWEAFALDGNRPVNPAELLESIRLCREKESLTYYRFNRRNAYSDRLFRYREHDAYYSYGEFAERTDGAGITKSFRACLMRYIQEHPAEGFSADGYQAKLRHDGRFVWCNAEISQKKSKTDNRDTQFFDYICYLSVKKFWEQFENIRNMHCEIWPSIVDAAGILSNPAYRRLLLQSGSADGQRIIKGVYAVN